MVEDVDVRIASRVWEPGEEVARARTGSGWVSGDGDGEGGKRRVFSSFRRKRMLEVEGVRAAWRMCEVGV